MLNRFFPAQFDNRFPGHKAGLWLFGVTVALKLLIGLRSIVSAREVAQGADGIPLDTFPAATAQQVVSIFGLLGLLHVTMALVCVAALVRYRAMIPLLFAVLLFERLGRKAIITFLPGATPVPGAPGAIVGLVLTTLLIAGLALSLWPPHSARAE